MITAQQARDILMAKDSIAAALTSLNSKITEAANQGRSSLEEPISPVTLGIQLSDILKNLGYDAKYQTHRQVLKV
jgi:hypothetical protein